MTRKTILFSIVASVFTAGCSVPGLHLDHRGNASPWYKQPDARYLAANEPQAQEYDPKVFEITPELIHRLRTGSDNDELDEALVRQTQQPYPEYTVGPGDLLGVIVYGHPDLTNPAGTTQSFEANGRLVNANGEVYFPFLGTVDVAGKTITEIRKTVTKGLERVIREPQVDVRVLQFRSQFVYVAGDVNRPCAVPLEDVPLTVIQALDACQSLVSEQEPFGVQAIRLVRDGRSFPLDLNALYRSGNPLRLRAGDRLIIDDSYSRVFLIGEFEEQTAAPYSAGGLSLADAIAAGEGLNLETADPGNIYVIRGFIDAEAGPNGEVQTRVRPRIFHLDASSVDALILADHFQLQPRDVVYAAPASLVNFNRALAQITPSLNLLFQSFLIFDSTRN